MTTQTQTSYFKFTTAGSNASGIFAAHRPVNFVPLVDSFMVLLSIRTNLVRNIFKTSLLSLSEYAKLKNK